MALKEVAQLTTEKKYEAICKQYDDLKNHISDCIEFEDFEVLSSYDITKIKELHFQKSALFWKLKQETVENRMKEIKHVNPYHYKHDVEYCELVIKSFQYYGEYKQAELKSQGDFYSYNKHHKPVIESRIIEWKLRLESSRKLKNMDSEHEEVKVIP